ncbi:MULTISPECIES: general stress protein [Bosea]|uniref:General stress protein n=1 Tax=Bosea rubneri TaxID=3075434 RepID=A0ABU3SAN9_9HYPH|nr:MULTISPECIES: general stress protein [unclassified Bosea (in: a-proteobacteria)]KUL93899.1 membrane protein [Bosea sp. WAO]MDU0341855.1 general stress protein [Bosea sp. ZW T0_25]
MTRTITRSYDDYADATAVVEDLERAGFSNSEISVIGRRGEDVDDSNAGEGAGIGAGVGGAAGLLAGLGMIAIPGIGPVVAAGWLAATAAGAAAGAAAGGIIGAMTSAGVDERDAHVYAESVRRGGSVVSVRAAEGRAAEAEAIMDRATPIDMATRRADYEREGWTQFDANASPYARPVI